MLELLADNVLLRMMLMALLFAVVAAGVFFGAQTIVARQATWPPSITPVPRRVPPARPPGAA